MCKCTDLTAGIRVDFEAKEAAEDHPEGWFGASREPSTSYDGGHTDLPAKARYFLTQSTAILVKSKKIFRDITSQSGPLSLIKNTACNGLYIA